MVAFHEELGLLPTIAGESMFRNKIPETLEPHRLCIGMKTLISDHDYELHFGGTAKPGIQKTLDCRAGVDAGCGLESAIQERVSGVLSIEVKEATPIALRRELLAA